MSAPYAPYRCVVFNDLNTAAFVQVKLTACGLQYMYTYIDIHTYIDMCIGVKLAVFGQIGGLFSGELEQPLGRFVPTTKSG